MPTTVTVDMFYIGNFSDMDTNETDNDNESPSLVLGLYSSLVFVAVSEVDVNDDGVLHDDEYATGDYLSYNTGGGVTNTALDSSSVYNADILLGNGSTISVPVLVIQAANGDVFVSEHPSNPLDNLLIQSIDLVSLNTSNAAGINQGFSDMQNTSIVCFCAGTIITTPSGTVPVASIVPGDLVMTLDHGPQPVRWVHSADQPLEEAENEAKPVLIQANSLGVARPESDLIVSPQHRILVGGCGQLQDQFVSETFAPAKALTSVPGIRHMNGKQKITWVHFAFDRHEIVFANGCMAESLLLGSIAMTTMTHRGRLELMAVFGKPLNADDALNGPAARKCLKVGDVRRHLAKCGATKRPPAVRGHSALCPGFAMEH